MLGRGWTPSTGRSPARRSDGAPDAFPAAVGEVLGMATRRAAVQAMAASEGTGGKVRSFPTTPGLRHDGYSLTVQRALSTSPEIAWEMFATAARVTDWFGARHRQE